MFVPVNRLPPEILSRVLEYRTSERDLVAATQVCRGWRYSLISSPSLWTCFQFKFSCDCNRTLTYLERSGSAPIDVYVNTNWVQDLDVLKYLAPHIGRTRSLTIHASYGVHDATLLLCNPAPLLQHLEIYASEGIIHLSDDFLGRQAPSLRSIRFNYIYPKLETLLPLPNLTEFHLSLPSGTGPLRMGTLFQFFSSSPLLQKIGINVSDPVVHDIPPGQVISLESLVELDYTSISAGQILPFLKLPRLERFQVTSLLRPGQAQTLANILPYGGRPILARATKMTYLSHLYAYGDVVGLSGSGVDVLFSAFCTTRGPISVNRFSGQTCVPLEQIEDLKLEGYSPTAAGFPIDFSAFRSLRVLRVAIWGKEYTEELLYSLGPESGAEVPCPSLEEIEIEHSYWGSQEPLPRLFIDLVRERKRAGHQLRLVCLVVTPDSDQDLVEELRKHVEEVQVREWVGNV